MKKVYYVEGDCFIKMREINYSEQHLLIPIANETDVYHEYIVEECTTVGIRESKHYIAYDNDMDKQLLLKAVETIYLKEKDRQEEVMFY